MSTTESLQALARHGTSARSRPVLHHVEQGNQETGRKLARACLQVRELSSLKREKKSASGVWSAPGAQKPPFSPRYCAAIHGSASTPSSTAGNGRPLRLPGGETSRPGTRREEAGVHPPSRDLGFSPFSFSFNIPPTRPAGTCGGGAK